MRRQSHGKNCGPSSTSFAPALFVSLTVVLSTAISVQAQTGNIVLNQPQQTIAGFGACSAWSGTMTSAEASTLFGTGAGQIGCSLWRVRIDPNGNNADETNNTTIAHSYGAKVLATPWSPPASMKSNNNTIGGSLNPSSYAAYAAFLNQSVGAIGADYVSLQNEPDYVPTGYEGCGWSPQQLDSFLVQEGGSIQYPIIMPESADFNQAMSDTALNDPNAVSHIFAIGEHGYGNNPGGYPNAASHGKQVWMTEHYTGNDSGLGSAIQEAKDINDWMDNNANAYIWWWSYMNTSYSTCNLVDGGQLLTTGAVLGQWAHFVRPGYQRVNATYNPQSGVYLSAFVGGPTVVVVAINNGSSAVNQTISFQGGSVVSVSPTQTDGTENMASLPSIPCSNNSFTANLPADSVTTFVGSTANAPSAPTGLTATPGNGQVSLSWTGASGATSYSIYRGTSAGGESSTPVTSGISSTTYTNTGLTNGTNYYFTVTAVNAGGTSPASNEANATPSSGATEAPYGSTPVQIAATGSTPIEAENYDRGGEGLAYHSAYSTNPAGSTYRSPDSVAVYDDPAASNGHGIGWTTGGEWQKYMVKGATAGIYTIAVRVASKSIVSGAMHVSDTDGANLTGSISVPNTGAWTTYQNTTAASVTLTAGAHTLQLYVDNGGYNIDSIIVSAPISAGTKFSQGQYLATGSFIASPSKNCFLIQQPDGNLVLYKGSGPNDNQGFLWGSLSASQPTGSYFSILQTDGNLVTYKGTGPNDNQGYVWANFTSGSNYLQITDSQQIQVISGTTVQWQKP